MSSLLPARPLSALLWALLFWLIGMVVGMIVFAVPSLKATEPIRHVASNPYITFPIVGLWVVVAWLVSQARLTTAPDPTMEGLRLGLMFAAVNFALDYAVLVKGMGTGSGFYAYLGPWLGYVCLVAVPWLSGRGMRHAA